MGDSLKKIISALAILIIGGIVSKFLLHSFFGLKTSEEALSEARKSYAKSLNDSILTPAVLVDIVKTVDSLNGKCPIQVDSITKLESVEFLQANDFRYNYKVAIDSRKYNVKVMKDYTDKSVNVLVQGLAEYQTFKRYKVGFIYSYVDANNKFMYTSEVIFH